MKGNTVKKTKAIAEPIDFNIKSMGQRTRELLQKKKIASPSISTLIEVLPNVKIAPKKPFKSEKQKQVWICKMINKYTK